VAAGAAVTSLQAELQALPYDDDKVAELDAAVEAEAEAVTRCRAAADETAGQLGGGHLQRFTCRGLGINPF